MQWISIPGIAIRTKFVLRIIICMRGGGGDSILVFLHSAKNIIFKTNNDMGPTKPMPQKFKFGDSKLGREDSKFKPRLLDLISLRNRPGITDSECGPRLIIFEHLKKTIRR